MRHVGHVMLKLIQVVGYMFGIKASSCAEILGVNVTNGREVGKFLKFLVVLRGMPSSLKPPYSQGTCCSRPGTDSIHGAVYCNLFPWHGCKLMDPISHSLLACSVQCAELLLLRFQGVWMMRSVVS